MAGASAKEGKCPDGFVLVFSTLCIEQTTIKKIEESAPSLPEVQDLSNPACEVALAALKSAVEQAEKAIEFPRKMLELAEDLVSRPFDEAQRLVQSTLSIFDEIGRVIDKLLEKPGELLTNVKEAFGKVLDCPFLADTAVGKLVASILDAMENGLPYNALLQQLKNTLGAYAAGTINQVKEIPLSAFNKLEDAYNKALEQSKVEELLKKVRDLYKCVEAACDMIKIARRLPKNFEDLVTGVGGVWDETTGNIKWGFYHAKNNIEKQAIEFAKSLKVITLPQGSGG